MAGRLGPGEPQTGGLAHRIRGTYIERRIRVQDGSRKRTLQHGIASVRNGLFRSSEMLDWAPLIFLRLRLLHFVTALRKFVLGASSWQAINLWRPTKLPEVQMLGTVSRATWLVDMYVYLHT